ncbi:MULTISPECIES: nitrous oxide reductase family maturation protein NosD [unclassified Rhodanobacter]|uniref:Nitrous oxide reductase family maturation protein NosD n=1 Tax=Rhodanobacter humi TaxID=1888173 RepID=A0ABV4AWB9_9GAMM|nr:nitrous oxide reductase family maturation protein NosD [Rhodanobacter sp. C06]OOG37697.1 copper-binding protein [Rhodanobacter sp. C06]
MSAARLSILTLAAVLVAPCTRAADDLTARVAAAAPGAVIEVPAGVHHVHLRVDKPLVLEGRPGAILDGDGRGDVLRIGADHVTVRNLDVRASGTDLTAMNAGIYVERSAHDVLIAGSTVEDSLFGIYLDGASDVQVRHNTVRGIRRLRVADRGDGIHLWNDTGCTIEDNDVGWSRDGIYVYVSTQNTIARNTVHDVRYGVHYMYSHRNRLTGNASRNNLAGYALMASDHLHVIGNTSDGDQAYGFLFNYISYSEIAGNLVRGVAGQRGGDGQSIDGGEGKGLFVYLSQFNAIHDNLVADSQIGIHVTAGSEHNRVWNNRFIDNRVQVKYAQNLAQEWSERGRGNFWSDYLGWDLDGDGIGDVPFRPNDSVDVLLWKYPAARSLMSSPSILLLRYVQRAFPVFTPAAVQDSHPLMRAPAPYGVDP